MNGVLLYPEETSSEVDYLITRPETRSHLIEHLKVKIGDTLHCIEVGIGVAQGIVRTLDESGIGISILSRGPVEQPSLSLIVGLSRPPTMKKILEHGTTMGVGHFYFISTALTEKSFARSRILSQDSVKEICALGLAQSKTLAYLPHVTVLNRLEDLPQDKSLKFCLSLKARTTLLEECHNTAGLINRPLTLAVGPERGWTENEEHLLSSYGFKSISISRSTLRVEHAVFSALAQWEMLKMARD